MVRNPKYVIAVHDLDRSARYYRDVLGFGIRMIGDPGWRFHERPMRHHGGQCPDALSPRIMFGQRIPASG